MAEPCVRSSSARGFLPRAGDPCTRPPSSTGLRGSTTSSPPSTDSGFNSDPPKVTALRNSATPLDACSDVQRGFASVNEVQLNATCFCDTDADWPATIALRKELSLPQRNKRNKLTVGQILRERSFAEQMVKHDSMDEDFGPTVTLDPESLTGLCRESFMVLAAFFDLVVMPFALAWNLAFEGPLVIAGWGAAVIWCVDLVLGFMTGFYRDGELEMRKRRIVQHYLRTWFIPNLVALFCDVLSMAMTVNFPQVRFLRIVDALRLFRLQRLFETIIDRFLSDTSRMILQGLKLFLAILWLNHVLSCAWYAIGRAAPSDTGGHWLDALMEDSSKLYHYFTAFHWTISQLTSGGLEDVAPLSTIERQFNIFCLIFGLIFVSSLVSSLSATLTHLKMQKQDQVQKLRVLRQFLSQKNVTNKMAIRVQRQVVQRMEKTKLLTDKDVPALALLSSNLRAELRFEMQQPCLQKHPLFRFCTQMDPGSVHGLCGEAMDIRMLSPGDNLFEFGQEATEGMYHVKSGCLRYMLSSMYTNNPEKPQAVSEGVWLCEVAMWTVWHHVGTAAALAPCELLVVSASQTLHTLIKHGAMKDIITEYSREFHRRVVSAAPPTVPLPTDLEVPFTDFADLVLSMSVDTQALIGGVALFEAKQRSCNEKLAKLLRFEVDVQEGRAVALLSERGEVERAVGLAALRLECDEGHLLVHLGRIAEGHVSPNVQLPFIKQNRGELPPETVRRLVNELGDMAKGAELLGVDWDTFTSDSALYGVTTRNSRSTYRAHIHQPSSGKGVLLPLKQLDLEQADLGTEDSLKETVSAAADFATRYPVHMMTSGELQGNLYAWLYPIDFELLRDEAYGKALVERWLHCLDLTETGAKASQQAVQSALLNTSRRPSALLRRLRSSQALLWSGSPSASTDETDQVWGSGLHTGNLLPVLVSSPPRTSSLLSLSQGGTSSIGLGSAPLPGAVPGPVLVPRRQSSS